MLLLTLSLSFTVILILKGPVAQEPSYHNFVDTRNVFSINNFWNVASNLPFIIVGFMGTLFWFKNRKERNLSLSLFPFFTGVFLTGLGSAYYHLNPNDQSLVWDRLPMAVAFMAFISFIIEEYIHKDWGKRLLVVFVLFGVASVLFWAATEYTGQGDLRPYIIVQFLPLLLFPFIIILFKSEQFKRSDMIVLLMFYVTAKFFEYFDREIYYLAFKISGHSIKHLLAAMGACWLLYLLKYRPRVLAKPKGEK